MGLFGKKEPEVIELQPIPDVPNDATAYTWAEGVEPSREIVNDRPLRDPLEDLAVPALFVLGGSLAGVAIARRPARGLAGGAVAGGLLGAVFIYSGIAPSPRRRR